MPIALWFLLPLGLVFLLTALFSHFLIPFLKSKKMGQKILDIGPQWHKSKEGTPTMGGLAFLIAILIIGGVFGCLLLPTTPFARLIPFFLTLLFALANSIVGIVDDVAKLLKKQNEGLTPIQKILLQVVFACAYIALMQLYGGITTSVHIPYTNIYFDLGFFYYIVAVFLILGVVNCANLTDGIDGLASSVALVIGGFFAFAGFALLDTPLLILGACLCGGAIGFLLYNFYPARAFMGDTGSLFFGALVVGGAFMMNEPLLILLPGIIYVFEGVSVILQVLYYKLTKKRLFLMAPVHHHFERKGFSEIKIVVIFSLVTLIACILAGFSLNFTH